MSQNVIIFLFVLFLGGFSVVLSEDAEETFDRVTDGRAVVDCVCGKRGRSNRKIVGGVVSHTNTHPWIAPLIYVGKQRPSQFCGASLISDTYVLTAGHCVHKTVEGDLRNYLVYLGSNKINETKDSMKFAISSVIKHPKFNPSTLDFDIALIRLARPVVFSQSVRPVCLARTGRTFAGKLTNVAGWGTLRKGGGSVNQLRETTVRVLTNGACASNYSKSAVRITGNMLCATLPGRDSCSGDSGGPLVLSPRDTADNTHRQIGIVSFGIDCGSPKFPGVYTRVSRFISWIKSSTPDANYCPKSF